MELGIREWMIIIGVLLLIAVLLDGIRKMREERRNHIRVAFKMGGGVCDEDSYIDPVDREVSKPRVIAPASVRADAKNNTRQQAQKDLTSKKVAAQKASVAAKPARKSVPEKIQEKTAAFTASLNIADEGIPEADRIEPDLGEAISFQDGESANDEPKQRRSASEEAAIVDQEIAQAKAKLRAKRKAETKPPVKRAAEVREFQPSTKQSNSKQASLDYNVADEFLAVYVLAKDEQGFNGADLLQILLACDLRFGKRNIFHRHEYKNGTGPIQFSMANIVEPGVFDLNTIETFQTPGVCFFISLPGPEDPLKAFDYMVETANCIVRNLHGDLKDEARSAMTAQTLSHYRQRVQEFERRQLTMSV